MDSKKITAAVGVLGIILTVIGSALLINWQAAIIAAGLLIYLLGAFI